jgi:DNA (cytosine-5)-methyltransferase 1
VATLLAAGVREESNELIERIAELLEVTYRSADLGNSEDPLAEAVYIMISRQTREEVYRDVFTELRRRYPRWEQVAEAPRDELRDLLRPSGLHEQRANQLKAFLQAVAEANRKRGLGPFGRPAGDLTLDYLREMPDGEAEASLRAFPGIGPKSARCILSYSLGRDAFAVDTHVRRIFIRLGLVESRGIKADHDPFQEAVPRRLRQQLHVNMVHHGRAVCQQTGPACHRCVLVSFCAEGRSRAAKVADLNAPVALDLFAGAGGLSEGFESAGFRIALAVDGDRHAAQTYRANHPGVPVVEGDVGDLTQERVRELGVGATRIDAVIAGPPCQGYSAAGKRLPDDRKNFLFRHVARLARDLAAEFVVMENVPGVQRVNGRRFIQSILDCLRYNGFSAGRHLLNAQDFGTPQRRRRYFFLARRQGAGRRPAAPAPTVESHEPGLLRTRLEDLPELAHGVRAEYHPLPDGRHLINGSTMRHSERVVRKIRKLKPGQGPISYRRLDEDAARTLIAGHRALPVHPWLHRTISVREAARIQGFRDDYVFCGPRSEQPLQVANAVPPAVAAAVAESVRAAWEQPGTTATVQSQESSLGSSRSGPGGSASKRSRLSSTSSPSRSSSPTEAA